jgi:hypothetical protein
MSIHGIRLYHGCYDAFSYLLFFPRGELGWYNCIPMVCVTMAEIDATRAIHKACAESDGGEDLST